MIFFNLFLDGGFWGLGELNAHQGGYALIN